MSKKAVTWLVSVLVVLALVVGLGPLIVGKIGRVVFKPKKELSSGQLKIKAKGKIAAFGDTLVLISPKEINHYVLVGTRMKELSAFADKKVDVFVFGNLMRANPGKVEGLDIRANIDVIEYDKDNFDVGSKLNTQVAESIKQKIKEKIEFREKVLAKIGKKGSDLNVIAGKLRIVECVRLADATTKRSVCLIVEDKYKDLYVLSNVFGGIINPIENYAQFSNKNLDIVVTGKFVVKDKDILSDPVVNYTTFGVDKIYNNNLSELVVPVPENKK